jgi:predicted MFS family arabinose efflux permease
VIGRMRRSRGTDARERPVTASRTERAPYGWGPLVALAAMQALESGERLSLSQAVEGIQDQFGVSDLAIGALPVAMATIAVVGSIPMGMLTDRRKRTTLLAGAMIIWTICMGLNGLVTSYLVLFAFRMGVGAVEATGPAAISLLGDYFPVRDRARAIGLFQSGALVGGIVGVAIGGIVVAIVGWRGAFFMWVPFGLVVAFVLARQPEPTRGTQDAAAATPLPGGAEVASGIGALLPPPNRPIPGDLSNVGARAVLRELRQVRSMWYAVLAITLGQLLLTGIQFWAVEFFKREHGLEEAGAGGIAAIFGLGAAVGTLAGGIVSDRFLRRGVVCARVYAVAIGGVGAALLLTPAFAAGSLPLAVPLFVVGGAFMLVPLAPVEALLNDVIVPELRGRASTVRSVVRGIGNAGPLVVGGLSVAFGLRGAFVILCPIYAAGGIAVLFAARHYPADVALVVATAQARTQAAQD